ncbi:hypothetical protein J8I26_12240 [Herbaspirillum sp. LeCh32-8]|uniref:hypothetical protein n=1 Tax=Herbaspirillum sp. LeCh32-8 TaxID=2821356 RepID=UPI001AE44825|nr:hypothetical protein [Herbaspirillum sp. LeCh32-8]MBP0598881.1 hypothetical protein [Herbaspirillum sp. LeCh32-8]
MAAHQSLLLSCLAFVLTACTTPSTPNRSLPIAERGLVQIDKQNRADLNRILAAAILHNPDQRERANFATSCYRDLAREKSARMSARLKTQSVDADIVEIAKSRNAAALATYPISKYWVRSKIEGRIVPVAFEKENLSLFQTFVEMSPHALLQDFADVNPVENKWRHEQQIYRRANRLSNTAQLLVRYGPIVQDVAPDQIKQCYIVFDVPKLYLSIPVDKVTYQQRLYESSKVGKNLEYTADVDIEYDFSDCRLENCTPKISDQSVRSFKFGWDPR